MMTLLWQTSAAAAGLTIALVLVLGIFGNRISPRWRCFLWALVAARLLIMIPPLSGPLSWQQFADLPMHGVEDKQSGADQAPIFVQPVDPFLPKVWSPPPSPDPEEIKSTRRWPWSLPDTLTGIYFLGLAIFLGLALCNLIRLRAMIRASQPAGDDLNTALRQACEFVGIKRTPQIRISEHAASPALAGLIRPVILFPAEHAGELSGEQLQHVLLHELGHFRRRDLWTQHLLLLLQGVHWFNPAVWFAFHRLRIEMERATDQWVLNRLESEEATNYGLTLLHILEKVSFSRPASRIPGTMTIAENKRDLKRRIAIISQHSGSGSRPKLAAAMATLAMAIFTFAAFTQGPVAPDRSPIIPEVRIEGLSLGKAYKMLEKLSEGELKVKVSEEIKLSDESVLLVMKSTKARQAVRHLADLAGHRVRFIGNWAFVKGSDREEQDSNFQTLLIRAPRHFGWNGNPGTERTPAAQVLADAGIPFPDGSSVDYDLESSILKVRNTPAHTETLLAFADRLLPGQSHSYTRTTPLFGIFPAPTDSSNSEMPTHVYVVPPTISRTRPPKVDPDPPFADLERPVFQSKRRTIRGALQAETKVTFPKGSFAAYNPATSHVVVRNTKENLALIEKWIEGYRSESPVQIFITTRLIVPAAPVDSLLKRIGIAQFPEVLTDPQTQVAIRAISNEPGLDLFSAPSVVTSDGQTATIETSKLGGILQVDHVISADRRKIRLHVRIVDDHPEKKNLTFPARELGDGNAVWHIVPGKVKSLLFIKAQLMDPAGQPIDGP